VCHRDAQVAKRMQERFYIYWTSMTWMRPTEEADIRSNFARFVERALHLSQVVAN
jgi:hypothetical protein